VGEEEKPEPTTNPAIQAIRRHWAFQAVKHLAPPIMAAFLAYFGATGTVEDRAKEVESKADVADDKATVTYKHTTAWVAELERRIVQLDAEVTSLKRAIRAGSKRPATVKVVVQQPAAPSPPPPLQPTVEKAVEADKATEPAKP
jgi:hypothetical protein